MTIRTAHPAATPAARALALLADYTPTDATDAWLLLAALHQYGSDSVIARLLEAIDALTTNMYTTTGISERDARRISECLNAASEIISGASNEWLDRAREVLPEPQSEDETTDGIPSWELNPTPPIENAGPADGYTRLTVPASGIRENDLLPGDTWLRVIHTHTNLEENRTHLTYRRTDGRVGTIESVAAVPHAILRPAGRSAIAEVIDRIRTDATLAINGNTMRQPALCRIRERADQLLKTLDTGASVTR